jgi:ATP-dependent DNA helicase RecQ
VYHAHEELPLPEHFAPPCLSLDLEVGVRDQRIHRFAALRGDGESLSFAGGDLFTALTRLDTFADGTQFLLGHNILAFDLPHLQAARPDLRLLQLPVVDTLRLNPLAFPRHPYHHLVKHYKDGGLTREKLSDPLLDAGLALTLFGEQQAALKALRATAPDLLTAWHWLTARDDSRLGFHSLFCALRKVQAPPTRQEGRAAVQGLLEGHTCMTQAQEITLEALQHGWSLAYALAWLSVAGGNSVLPPWVLFQYPDTVALVRRLRDTACSDPACAWCRERHDAGKELTRFFGFPGFRPEPAGVDGRPLQQIITEAALRGAHVLGILPTGTGKSLCYQIPALSRYEKTGALTVVISPLVALMSDQVTGLEARGITTCAAVNGLLSMPERKAALDRVRLGDTAILIISPEQLRSKGVRRALRQRTLGAWVLDEAHCLSKWGHDFRPDYRYVGRVIKQEAGDGPLPPVLCLTATAKPDVVTEIREYFRDLAGIEISVFDGGASRTNLDFAVLQVLPAEKATAVAQLIETELLPAEPGGTIVYCSSRKRTEELAGYLREKDQTAEYFHAGLTPECKKDTQGRFLRGDIRVIVATNAFGMGIDKSDVRLVLHADMPGSLENYLQEAGRAGRDGEPARCVLLFAVYL